MEYKKYKFVEISFAVPFMGQTGANRFEPVRGIYFLISPNFRTELQNLFEA